MPSPFPGMDPYLEDPAFWPDFHSRFITYWCDAIADLLPDRYEARINERVQVIDLESEAVREIRPDVTILREDSPSAGRPAAAPAGVAAPEPITVPLLIVDEPRETFIEIWRGPDRSVITVLELLSPTNKVGSDRSAYLTKRNALIHEPYHLVELDLLLGGRRLPFGRPLPAGDYYAFVSRGDHRPDCQVYAWTVQQPLPRLPVPLQAPDPDILLDLGAVFATAYERGRYARSLPYQAAPPAPVRPEVRDWVLAQAQRATG